MIENKTSLRPRYADTDQMGIVYYAKYLEWFEVGRTELLRDIGLPYTTIEREGIILPVIEALHPTPALGGRPRDIALSIINENEPISRGWYGSPIGWLDPQQNGVFAVAIRSAVTVNQETLLYAGAGIVADSIPDKEWRETQLKFKPLIDALGGANKA